MNTTLSTSRRTFLKQLGLGAAGLGTVWSVPDCLAGLTIGRRLPRSAPEAQGVSSEGILSFLEAIAKSNHEFHSFMMLRHGHVIAEGWWRPYRPEAPQMMYSLSKSFTSTAVGFAVSEGKLTVNDSVTSFFPGDLPEKVSEHLAALRVKHLLTMSVGHAKDSTPSLWGEENWVRKFLSLPIENAPGTAFLYNSGATYMLSAIVQKVTGQKVLDYLQPRLFGPLEIEGLSWETCPRGINTGGWGLKIQTEGLAKFGQLYLQKGNWNGRQLLSREWLAEATSFKIQQPAPDLERAKKQSDWHQGYCYQFWRCRHNAFRGDGAFGQFTIVMPEQDAVIAITSESPNMQGELDLVWDHLLPAMKEKTLPAAKPAQAELKEKLAALLLPPPKGQASSPIAARIWGKQFRIKANEAGVQSVSLQFRNLDCLFTLKDDRGQYSVDCGIGRWVDGQTAMPGTPPKLTQGKLGPVSKLAASGTWRDDQTFEMQWRFYETPHHDTVTCRFDGDNIRVEYLDSLAQMNPTRKDKRPALEGSA
ncbi:MAG TPA: serine hydrolase [Candidatus Binatia bacterium]|nr:serine hydrolase [Candidatus Binatia bacterium]